MAFLKMKRTFPCIVLACCLAGCAQINLQSHDNLALVAVGGAAYYYYSKNWTLDEAPQGNDRFRITLKKNMHRQDGDSEADSLFKRRAKEISAENGFDGYRILEYTEGIESADIGAQRVAQGTIQCTRNVVGTPKK